MSRFLVIRADASTYIGDGHVMRCLALAQAWQEKVGQVVFITSCESSELRHRLLKEGFEVINLDRPYPASTDWEITSQVLDEHPRAWVVLDGYHFTPEYHGLIKEMGYRLLVIDDMAHLNHYYTDLLLNQNINAKALNYSCEHYTRLLLGPPYVLLRSEFRTWRKWQREIPKVARKVLVTLGGGDPDNQTLKVIKALRGVKIDGLEAVVVVGASNPHFQELRSATSSSQFPIRLIHNVINMPELMVWADIAVSAGGSTCWEIAFMGLPNLILVLSENQRGPAEGLDAAGITLNLGWHAQISESVIAQALKMLMSSPEHREAMRKKGQKLIDGTGTDHVVSIMKKPAQKDLLADNLRVRPACYQDAELLWRWANDPSVRANAIRPEAIPLSEHINWLEKKLASPDTRIWLLELDHVPIAQIRYDRINTDVAEIDFSVVSHFRRRRVGTRALALTSSMACMELKVKDIKGTVFSSNEASVHAFTKANFRRVGQESIGGKLYYIFERKCSETIRDER